MAWLYGTIWASLLLFSLGEFGKRRAQRGQSPPVLWLASAAGWVLLGVHIFLALYLNDDWNHALAWQVTDTRTREIFGFGWGGALLANYVFAVVWAIDLIAWRSRPRTYSRLPKLARLGLRLFYLCIIIPAAVVFAAGPRRWMGVVVVLALLWAWRPVSR